MGFKCGVYAWRELERGGYDFETVYEGQSLIKALLSLPKAKRISSGYVRFEWR